VGSVGAMSGLVCAIAMAEEGRRWVDSFMATTRMAIVGEARFLLTLLVAVLVRDYNLPTFRFRVRDCELVIVLLW
jgi:hypothetical protein